MEKVVFINPNDSLYNIKKNKTVYENLGIGYLSAALKTQNIKSVIFDECIEDIDYTNLKQALKDSILVGISCYDSTFERAIELAQIVKKEVANVPIVFGGYFPTMCFEEIMKEYKNTIDYIIIGEGEFSVIQLVEHIKDNIRVEQVPGLIYYKNDKLVKNEYSYNNFYRSIFPDRYSLEKIPVELRIASLVSSRGCYGSCTFCSINSFHGITRTRGWRPREYNNVVDEIQDLMDKYEVTKFEFVDETFLGVLNDENTHAIDFADEIKRRNIKIQFSIECRADEISEERIKQLYEAGLRNVLIGVESGNNEILCKFSKNIDTKMILKSIEILNKYKINYKVGYLILHPYSTLDTIYKDLTFLQQIASNEFFRSKPRKMCIYHNTPIQKSVEKEKRLIGSYRHYDFRYLDSRVERFELIVQEIFDIIKPAVIRNELTDKLKMAIKEKNEKETKDVIKMLNLFNLKLNSIFDLLIVIVEKLLKDKCDDVYLNNFYKKIKKANKI